MLNQQQIDAIQAAIDIAYDGIASDDRERLEMEDHARTGFEYVKTAAQAEPARPSRWKVLTTATKSTGILMCIKQMIGVDPYRRVVCMPEVDYKRVMARMANLERVALERKAKIAELETENEKLRDDLLGWEHNHYVGGRNGAVGQDVGGRPAEVQEDGGPDSSGGLPEAVQSVGVGAGPDQGAGEEEGQAR